MRFSSYALLQLALFTAPDSVSTFVVNPFQASRNFSTLLKSNSSNSKESDGFGKFTKITASGPVTPFVIRESYASSPAPVARGRRRSPASERVAARKRSSPNRQLPSDANSGFSGNSFNTGTVTGRVGGGGGGVSESRPSFSGGVTHPTVGGGGITHAPIGGGSTHSTVEGTVPQAPAVSKAPSVTQPSVNNPVVRPPAPSPAPQLSKPQKSIGVSKSIGGVGSFNAGGIGGGGGSFRGSSAGGGGGSFRGSSAGGGSGSSRSGGSRFSGFRGSNSGRSNFNDNAGVIVHPVVAPPRPVEQPSTAPVALVEPPAPPAPVSSEELPGPKITIPDSIASSPAPPVVIVTSTVTDDSAEEDGDVIPFVLKPKRRSRFTRRKPSEVANTNSDAPPTPVDAGDVQDLTEETLDRYGLNEEDFIDDDEMSSSTVRYQASPQVSGYSIRKNHAPTNNSYKKSQRRRSTTALMASSTSSDAGDEDIISSLYDSLASKSGQIDRSVSSKTASNLDDVSFEKESEVIMGPPTSIRAMEFAKFTPASFDATSGSVPASVPADKSPQAPTQTKSIKAMQFSSFSSRTRMQSLTPPILRSSAESASSMTEQNFSESSVDSKDIERKYINVQESMMKRRFESEKKQRELASSTLMDMQAVDTSKNILVDEKDTSISAEVEAKHVSTRMLMMERRLSKDKKNPNASMEDTTETADVHEGVDSSAINDQISNVDEGKHVKTRMLMMERRLINEKELQKIVLEDTAKAADAEEVIASVVLKAEKSDKDEAKHVKTRMLMMERRLANEKKDQTVILEDNEESTQFNDNVVEITEKEVADTNNFSEDTSEKVSIADNNSEVNSPEEEVRKDEHESEQQKISFTKEEAGETRAQFESIMRDVVDTKSLTQRIMENTSDAQSSGAGGSSTWEAFQRVEANWARLKSYDPSTDDVNPMEFISTDGASGSQQSWEALRVVDSPKYDVIVCGGTLGIFIATSLLLMDNTLKIAVIEAGVLQGRAQEWNISMKEMEELVELGVLTNEEVAEAIATEFPGCRSGFKNDEVTPLRGGYFSNGVGYECVTPNVLNLGVSPSILISRVADRFHELGGSVIEKCRLQGVVVSEAKGAALDIGKDNDPLTTRLVLDCMGNASPISRQQRQGIKPDGVCAVVGSCAAGFEKETNLIGDIIYTNSEIQDKNENGKLQYFWEAFPVGIGREGSSLLQPGESDVKTTYMFTYMDANEDRPSLTTLMEDYWKLLPIYQPSIEDPEKDLDVKRVLFAYFPTYRDSPLQPKWSRVLAVGDASGIQSPLSFGGFGALTRHLERISGAVVEALDGDLLHKESLSLINPYTPNLSATWMFQKAMSVKMGQKVDPKFVNRLLATNFQIMNDMGMKTITPFLQDVVRFDGLVGSLARSFIADPLFMPQIVNHVGVPALIDWLGHLTMIATYSILHNYYSPVVRYVIEKNPSMSEKDRFKLKRQMEAWKFGSGYDYDLSEFNSE